MTKNSDKCLFSQTFWLIMQDQSKFAIYKIVRENGTLRQLSILVVICPNWIRFSLTICLSHHIWKFPFMYQGSWKFPWKFP